MTSSITWVAVCMVAMVTPWLVKAKVIDLSHAHDMNTIMSPDNPAYQAEVLFAEDFVPGIFATSRKYSLGEHGGTHIDVPSHFFRNGITLEKVPITSFIADGVMIDCSTETGLNPGYNVTLDKIKKWEESHGPIPKKAAVIFNFNWSSRFSNGSLYFNTNNVSDHNSYNFPTVSAEAINYLYNEKDIAIIATDTYSPDPLDSRFPVHLILLGNDRIIVENINNPQNLPPRNFRFYCTPAKFVGASGLQVRAFAMTYDPSENAAAVSLGKVLMVIALSLGALMF